MQTLHLKELSIVMCRL